MKTRSLARIITVLTVGAIAMLAISAPALAKGAPKKSKVKKPRPAVTHMVVGVDDRSVEVGQDVTGSLRLVTRSGRTWVPLASASVTVKVGAETIGTVVTDTDGRASFAHTTSAIGVHHVRAFYGGDATHKRSRANRSFKVYTDWFADADADTYGDAAVSVESHEQPEGYVLDNTDCDDANAAVNPGASEVAENLVDDDCDGSVDETEGETVVITDGGTEGTTQV